MIASSELVLAPDGTLYHIHLNYQTLADDIILVGDPQRVEMFKPLLDTIEFETQNREIHALTGTFNNHRFTILSTGMGTDNIDIVLTELDAAANMDLDQRSPRPNHRKLRMVRIGTSGSLQPDIPCGAYVASAMSVGLDGLLNYYQHQPQQLNESLTLAFQQHMDFEPCFAHPYGVDGSTTLLNCIGFDMHHGITATAPGFYAPQGRNIRIAPAIPDLNERLASFRFNNIPLTNLEMETSAIYGLSSLMGHEALTVCLIIANRPNGDFLNDYHSQMGQLIHTVLTRLSE